MKNTYLCSSVALACALGLAACGGSDDGELQLGGALSGVTKAGLKLSNNGGAPVDIGAGTAFVFPTLVPRDSDYNIAIVAKPPNTDSCVVVNGKGNTFSYSPNNIAVNCVVTTFPISGGVTGLTGGDLVINNGGHSVKILNGATTFTMNVVTEANPNIGNVPEGVPYGLTILQQPARGTCSIDKANGIMPAAAVTDVAITCVTPAP